MNIFKPIAQIFFVIIFFSTLQAKNLDKFNEGSYISDYFSGILLLNDNQYNESYSFLKKLDGLEESHLNYVGYVEGNNLYTGDVDVIVCFS